MQAHVARFGRWVAITIALCLGARRASAQGLLDSVPDQHLWLSGALGTGSVNGSIAAELSLWYAGGGFALAVQANADDAIFGDQRQSTALLAGWTHGAGHHRFVGALGLARVHSFRCSDDGGCAPGVHHIALAFGGEAFVNAPIAGIGLDTFGAIGGDQASYAAIGLSVQLGWLQSIR